MSKNVPKGSLGLPGSLPEKCPKNVWKMSWCWGWRWKNVQKMSKRCPPDLFQTFFDIFWQLESQKGARARSARAPFWVAAEGRHLSICQKMSKKCLEKVWGTFFDIFWTFFQRQPQHQDIFQTFFGHFSGRLPGSPKRPFGSFF